MITSVPRKLTTEEFIERARSVHGDRYDYSRVVYVKGHLDVEIGCPEHGWFKQTPVSHAGKRASGCNACSMAAAGRRRASRGPFASTASYIARAVEVHGVRYSYHLVDVRASKDVIVVVCPLHGGWRTTAWAHVTTSKIGCPGCASMSRGLLQRTGNSDFIKAATAVHGDRYDYSRVKYTTARKHVEVVCPSHGAWWITPTNHVSNRRGCPGCKRSKGETRIFAALLEVGVDFVEQAKFDTCRSKRKLPFDFHVPDLNLLIEYDGEQHFPEDCQSKGSWHTPDLAARDQIKNEWARSQGVNLLRVGYTEDDVIPSIVLSVVEGLRTGGAVSPPFIDPSRSRWMPAA